MLIQVYKLHGAEGFINRDAARIYKPLEQQVGGSGRGSAWFINVYTAVVHKPFAQFINRGPSFINRGKSL